MGLFDNIAREYLYSQTLTRQFKGKKAMDKGLKVCQKCGGCCHVKPCAMSPKELAVMAEAKGLSPSDFFMTFCVVDTINGVPLTVLPRRVGQTHIAGRWVPTSNTWDTDPCVFWAKGKGCTMYRVRPKSARAIICGVKPPRPLTALVPKWSQKALKALGWDGKKGEADDDDCKPPYEEDIL